MPRAEVPLEDPAVRAAWQRKDLVIAALHARGCETCDQVRAALSSRQGLPSDPELGVVILSRGADAEDQRIEALLRAAHVSTDGAFVLIADRFLELFTALDAHGQPADALVRDIASWAEAVLLQCGECSRMPG